MRAKKQPQPVATVFRAYFKRHTLDQLVKNLYVVIPEVQKMFAGIKTGANDLSASLLKMLTKENPGIREKISIIDF